MERKKERVGRKKAKVWGVGEVTNDEAGGRRRKDEVVDDFPKTPKEKRFTWSCNNLKKTVWPCLSVDIDT